MLVKDPPAAQQEKPLAGEGPPAAPRRSSWPTSAVFVTAILVALVAALLAVFVVDDDDGTSPSAVTPTTTPPPTATTTVTVPATTAPGATATPTTKPATTAPAVVPIDTSSAVWPTASGPVYRTPVAAARGFAVDFVGFTAPVVGAFRQGDSRSGEVDIRATATGPVTTILVRQLGAGGRWFVLGSATANLNLVEPSALSKVTSPLRLRGTSTAFEANVTVQVRQDGTRQPIGTGSVMGGSMGQMGPFDGTVTFRRPTAKAGAVLLLTYSMEDGRVWEASVVRVSF